MTDRPKEYYCAVCGVVATRVVSLRLCDTAICAAALCEHHAWRVQQYEWGLCVQNLPAERVATEPSHGAENVAVIRDDDDGTVWRRLKRRADSAGD